MAGGRNNNGDDDEDTDYDPEVDYAAIPLPPAPSFLDAAVSEEPEQQQQQQEGERDGSQGRTTRPGQKGFAQRLMAKYGWTKGSGLGASSSGITSALRVQVEKRKRRPDAEGGGFATPAGMGRIIAPKKKAATTTTAAGGDGGSDGGSDGKFGRTSLVVVLDRMLDNMPDLEAEVEAGLGQEIGEECGERYGRVERIVVDVERARVFIKFVETVSALRVSPYCIFLIENTHTHTHTLSRILLPPFPRFPSFLVLSLLLPRAGLLTHLGFACVWVAGCQCARGQDIQRKLDRGAILRRGQIRGGSI